MEREILAYAANEGILLYLNGEGKLAFKAKKKGAMNAELRERITQNKSALIHYLVKQEQRKQQSLLQAPIKRVSREQKLPLSFAQQRLWMLDQIDGGSSHYNMPMALLLKGEVDIGAFNHAFEEIVRRHEVLRTCFVLGESGEPYQEIKSPESFNIDYVDLSHLTSTEQQRTVLTMVRDESNAAFNLESDYMLRVTLVQKNTSEYLLLLTLHHIASDGWSTGLLINEFSQLYRAKLENTNLVLPSLDIQYADYASWQRQWLQGEVLESHSRYWTEKLEGLPVVHSLPLDKPRPLVQTFNGGGAQTKITSDLAEKVKTLCEQEQASVFMALTAVLTVLLGRYSNEKDIVLGTPAANRDQAEVGNLIGFFVNLLVLRSDLSDNPSFLELLKKTRDDLLSSYQHQQYPFEQLVDKLLPQRSLSHSPLFQVMVVMQNNEEGELALPGLSVSSLNPEFTIAKYDLTLLITEQKDGLVLDWEFNTDLFHRETISQLANHFSTLLTAVIDTPDKGVFDAPLLTDKEFQHQVIQWNDTKENYPNQVCIEELFLNQVQRTPNAIAIIDEQGQCTYIELLDAVVGLLQKLEKRTDIGPEQLIGIRLPRGRNQVISTLAVMMSGSAYLPLECDWPDERCNLILQSANVPLLITQSLEQASELDCIDNIDMTGLSRSGLNAQQLHKVAQNYRARQKKNNLAYVIFTSGSTGTPKGVAVEHASVVNTLHDINARFGIDHNDRVLAVSALSFDLSVYDFFGLLAVGGTIVIPHEQRAKDPAHWLDLVEKYQVNIWNTVPISMVLLVEQLEYMSRFSSVPLKCVLMSGDWIPPDTPKRIWQTFGCCDVYSLGGATEGSIWSIYHPVSEDTSSLTSIPYGRPLGNQAFYILNECEQHCPVGVTGELYIGGAGVVREYLNNDVQTKSHFIWHEGMQQKLYRTGDLGRYMSDGNIEFCGRKDNQLKIRGFRVELGEIEKTLLAHESVKKALVIAFDNDKLGKQIGAYVVLEQTSQDIDFTVSSLKEYLVSHLPYYMQPRGIQVLDEIPLTANGKVDRRSLPAISGDDSRAKFEPPRGKTEVLLATLWQQVLSIPEVGRHENFFNLGGHSLLAARCVALTNSQLDMNITLADFFQNPTISMMSQHIERDHEQESRVANCVQLLNQSEQSRNLFFIHPGSGFAYCYRELAQELNHHAKCFGIHSPLITLGDQFEQFDDLINYYCEQIQAVQDEGPYFILGYSSGGVIAHEVAIKLQNQKHTVKVGLLDTFATLIDYDSLTSQWYSPIKAALEEVLEVEVDFEWSSLELDASDADKLHELERLGEAIIEQGASPYMPAASKQQLAQFLMHYYHLHRLKSSTEISVNNIECTLFKAAIPSAFNQHFNQYLGWDEFNRGVIQLKEINCKHEDMLESSSLEMLKPGIISFLPENSDVG